MDLRLTPEQQDLQSMARGLLGDYSRRLSWGVADLTDDVLRECWEALAGVDLLAVGIPGEVGGADGGPIEWAIVCEEVGRAGAPVPLDLVVPVAAEVIARAGDAGQRERILPDVFAGRAIVTAAIAESDPARLPALVSHGGDRTLVGTVRHVPHARGASVVVVPARDERGGVELVLVDPSDERVQLHTARATDFTTAEHLTFADVPVADGSVLGGADGEAELSRMRARALAASCATQIGLCTTALEMTAAHCGTRRQFGRPLGAFQAVTQRLANAYIDLRTMQVATWRLVYLLDQGSDDVAVSASVAKVLCSVGARRIMRAAVHLHGGLGVDVTYPLARYVVMAKRHELWLGGAESHLERLATEIETPEGLERALAT